MPKPINLILLSCTLLFWSCKSSKIETVDFSDGSYEGELNRKKQKHGKGFFRWSDGSYYNGEYHHDKRHGEGRFLWANGETYEGRYVEDERTGSGVYRWPDGSIYEGSFFKGKRHGFGSFTSFDGIRYEGDWLHDQQHGNGRLFFPNGKQVNGVWTEGELVASNSVTPEVSPIPIIPKVNLPQVSLDHSSHEPEIQFGSPKKFPESQLAESRNPSNTAKQVDLNALKPNQDSQSIVADSQNTENSANSNPENYPESESNLQRKFSTDVNAAVWRGTASQAEIEFNTELIDGVDTIKERRTNTPFTGR